MPAPRNGIAAARHARRRSEVYTTSPPLSLRRAPSAAAWLSPRRDRSTSSWPDATSASLSMLVLWVAKTIFHNTPPSMALSGVDLEVGGELAHLANAPSPAAPQHG